METRESKEAGSVKEQLHQLEKAEFESERFLQEHWSELSQKAIWFVLAKSESLERWNRRIAVAWQYMAVATALVFFQLGVSYLALLQYQYTAIKAIEVITQTNL